MANQTEAATTTGRNEGNLNDDQPCEPSIQGPKLDITEQNRDVKMATTHPRELYDAVQDLCKYYNYTQNISFIFVVSQSSKQLETN